MMFPRKMATLALLLLTLAGPALAADNDSNLLKNNGSLDRLFKQAGVYNTSSAGKTPGFVVDPAWPQPLPNNWLLGQIGGLFVDRHDHIWVYNRPRTMTNEEAGQEGPVPGAVDQKGQPINGLGQVRVYGSIADCCKAAPSVLEFDADGKLLRAWGGPADPGFLGGKCKPDAGCIWPSSEHGIYVDQKDNVWLSGNLAAADQGGSPWATNKQGGDGFVLKFDMDGNFKMRIGGTPKGPNSNDTDGGINGTPLLYQAADMVVDAASNRLYIADGYGNRRVLIVDADSGKYIGHFGAYGNNPIDDAAAKAAGPWIEDYTKGNKKPAFFRNPVHCIKIAKDGKMYVCDRGNDRIQVFDTHDPALGKPCGNPSGAAGKCGFVAEQFVSDHTNIIGTAVSMSFSTDKAQSCLYVGDNANMTIYVLNRTNLQELGRLGRSGRMAGEFHWLHQVSLDSKGNIYTGEVDTGKRIQKFVRYGATGCSGNGSSIVGGPPVTAPFTAHTVATGIRGGYQVIAADLNHDGKVDLIGLGSRADSLVWYENPSWTPHILVSAQHMINAVVGDPDKNGIPEIVLAYGFNSNPASSTGNVAVLHTGGDPTAPWTLKEIDQIPAAHRLRFADVAGNGHKVLVVAPVLNAKAKGFPDPDHLPTPLLMYHPGDWKRELIPEDNKGVVHGLLPFDWYGDGRQDVLTAGYSGVFVHSLDKDGKWKHLEISGGSPEKWPHGGAGEIAVGKMKGKQFFVTIEPFHGNMVVVYTQDAQGQYQRNVIDTDLVNGHTITLVDVDGDGSPEIVASGSGTSPGLFYYRATSATGEKWQKMLMDNDMSAQSCVTADIKGDRRNNDIVCIDVREPNSIKWYEYQGK